MGVEWRHVVLDVIKRCVLDLIVVWEAPYLAVAAERNKDVVVLLEAVRVSLGVLSLALQILSTGEASVGVQIVQRCRTHLLEIEVEHVPFDLAQVRTISPCAL